MDQTILDKLKAFKNKSNRIKLINNEVLKGEIVEVSAEYLLVKMPDNGAGSPTYTVPMSSILFISDCDL